MKKKLGEQSGQAIVEAILLIVLFFGVSVAIAKYFESEQIISQLVSKPWKSLSGVLQNGVWKTPEAGAASHPSTHVRHVSIEGETP